MVIIGDDLFFQNALQSDQCIMVGVFVVFTKNGCGSGAGGAGPEPCVSEWNSLTEIRCPPEPLGPEPCVNEWIS